MRIARSEVSFDQHMERKREFAEFVWHMRKSVGWTQSDLAREMRVTRSHINSYERMRHIPRDQKIFEKTLRELVKNEKKNQREIEAFYKKFKLYNLPLQK